MPDIEQSYQLENVQLAGVYQESLRILKNIGASDIKEKTISATVKEAEALVPSVWGWGGMKVRVRLEQTAANRVLLVLHGYIAQLATSPLTKKMDAFLRQLQSALETKYGSSFEYEKLTQLLPKYKLSINAKDKKIFIVIIVVTFFTTLLGEWRGLGGELLTTGAVILVGYALGKKYLNR